jgi:hypothetical protein
MSSYVDWADVDAAAVDMAGNHRKFESFGWHDRPEDSDKWAIVYTHNRDSDLLAQSNADAIGEIMEPFVESEDVVPERHSHWACGWVDGYSIRVFDDNGNVTDAFRAWCEVQERINNYPLLNEEDHSRREYEAALESITQEGRRMLVDGAAEDWAEQVFSWLWENNQRELENRDGNGACPSEESVREALDELGLLDEES